MVLVGLLATACTATGRLDRPAAPPASVGTRDDRQLPRSVLTLPLVDSSGRPTSLSAFAGRILVVSDVLTLCQETCPMDTADLVDTARAVSAAGLGDRVEFVSITVDPDRDTPARMAAYRRLYAPTPANWAALTGSAASLTALWHYLGVYHQRVAEYGSTATDWLTGRPLTYDVTHSDLVFFLDSGGRDRFVVDGVGHVAAGDRLPAALSGFLSDEGRHNLAASPSAGTWTVGQALAVVSWLVARPIPGASIAPG
jgi:protein SCO1/2